MFWTRAALDQLDSQQRELEDGFRKLSGAYRELQSPLLNAERLGAARDLAGRVGQVVERTLELYREGKINRVLSKSKIS